MYDKLDLLGVQYDAELEYRAKHEMAERIASYWKENCTDDEFYKNCIENIREELQSTHEEDVYDIWKIIEKNYL